MTEPTPAAAVAHFVNSIAEFEAWVSANGYHHDGTTWLDKDDCPVDLAEELLRAAMAELDDSPDYDDVVAWAKANGYDPYLPSGEYNPKVITWGINALSKQETT